MACERGGGLGCHLSAAPPGTVQRGGNVARPSANGTSGAMRRPCANLLPPLRHNLLPDYLFPVSS